MILNEYVDLGLGNLHEALVQTLILQYYCKVIRAHQLSSTIVNRSKVSTTMQWQMWLGFYNSQTRCRSHKKAGQLFVVTTTLVALIPSTILCKTSAFWDQYVQENQLDGTIFITYWQTKFNATKFFTKTLLHQCIGNQVMSLGVLFHHCSHHMTSLRMLNKTHLPLCNSCLVMCVLLPKPSM